MRHPHIVIFGRANVGKSTLFNRLVERPKALTSPVAGTTRNINADIVYWRGINLSLIDTGGIESVVPKKKLKKLSPAANTEFAVDIIKQTQRELKRADVVVFVVDLHTGLVPEDRELARHLKTLSTPVVLVGNKADGKLATQHRGQVSGLGLGEATFVSAKNGMGTGDLLDAIVQALPAPLRVESDTKYEAPESIKVSLIGRPNVGKSSLLNAVVGEERVIVSPVPHTTRESFDTFFEYGGKTIQLIDTAGLRRGARVAPDSLERTGMRKSIISAQQSDICLLIVDISQPLTVQDSHLAQMITEKRRGIIIVANKWDIIPGKTTHSPDLYTRYIYGFFPYLTWAPIAYISAKTGKGVDALLTSIIALHRARTIDLSDEELETFLAKAIRMHRPAAAKGARPPRLVALRQLRTNPPEFDLRVGPTDTLHTAYGRYLENLLRDTYDLWGVPIKISISN